MYFLIRIETCGDIAFGSNFSKCSNRCAIQIDTIKGTLFDLVNDEQQSAQLLIFRVHFIHNNSSLHAHHAEIRIAIFRYVLRSRCYALRD